MRLHPKAGITTQERALEEGFEGQAEQDGWGTFRESTGTCRALRCRESCVCVHMYIYTSGHRVLVRVCLAEAFGWSQGIRTKQVT